MELLRNHLIQYRVSTSYEPLTCIENGQKGVHEFGYPEIGLAMRHDYVDKRRTVIESRLQVTRSNPLSL